MQAILVIDVPGGPVRVRYEITPATQQYSTRIKAYTRNRLLGSTAGERKRQDREKAWAGLETTSGSPPYVRQAGQRIPLPVDVAWPRTLDARYGVEFSYSSGHVFALSNGSYQNSEVYSTRDRGTVTVTFTQLFRVVPETSEHYRPTTGSDDRADGAPSSPFVTYLHLRVCPNNEHSFDVVLRSRIQEVKESETLICGRKWYPSEEVSFVSSLARRK